MAEDTTASIITLHQAPQKRAKTPAERARAYRQRKKTGDATLPVPAVTPLTSVQTPPVTLHITPPRRPAAPPLLIVAAFALAIVGMIINGWFARSLGSSDVAGWLFLAIGVAADLVALAVPSGFGRRASGQQPPPDGPLGP